MIPIKINGKKHLIKSINELTTKEFIDFMKIEKPDKLKLIGFLLGVEYEVIFKSKISESVLKMIGEIPDIEKLPVPKTLLRYHVKRFGIESIGQRFQVETCNLKGYDLLIFIVAVAIVNDPNLDKVNIFIDKLYKLPFVEVLPIGYFFFSQFSEWQEFRKAEFKKCSVIDKNEAKKKQAGIDNLNKYSNFIEVYTLSEILNIPFSEVLKTSDIFCTKTLLYNLEKANFDLKFNELMSKK